MPGNPARKRRRWHAALLLAAAVALAGCDLTLGYDRDIEGFYDYAGTVRYSPGYAVVGEIYIDQRSSRTADAAIQWFMLEGSQTILEIEADDIPVTMYSNGRIRFVAYGDIRYSDGTWSRFELEHEGRVDGRVLRGEWRLTTDLPSTDEGTFSASR